LRVAIDRWHLMITPVSQHVVTERLLCAVFKSHSRRSPRGCREPHLCRSRGVFVFVEEAAQAFTSADVVSGELARVGDRGRIDVRAS
jgi:hypothetical protein